MPLIQLQPHTFTILPAHPSLPPGPSRPEVRQVASTALQEALELLNSDLPTWNKDSKPRRSPPAHAEIKLFRKWRRHEIEQPDSNSASKQKPEFWCCRQSEHHDAPVAGSASWSEFEDGLRSEHAEHEMEYTPSVTGVERLLQWTEQEIGQLDMDGVTFKDVDVEDQSSTPTAIYEKIQSAVPKRTIFANYASVERVARKNRPIESASQLASTTGQASPPTSLIQWTMATTSDASGLIPQWMQRNWTLGGVPRAIVADVGLFIDWTTKRRGSA